MASVDGDSKYTSGIMPDRRCTVDANLCPPAGYGEIREGQAMTDGGFHRAGSIIPAGRYRPVSVVFSEGGIGVESGNPDGELMPVAKQEVVADELVIGRIPHFESAGYGFEGGRMRMQVIGVRISEERKNQRAPEFVGLNRFVEPGCDFRCGGSAVVKTGTRSAGG